MKMKSKLATCCFIIGGLLSPVAAHAADSDSDRTSPSSFVQDSAIATRIKAKLASEPSSSLAMIRVYADGNGVVSLNGTVRSEEEANKAVAIASESEGVISVLSNLEIKDGK